MEGTQKPETVSTKLRQIAKLARKHRDEALVNVAHHIDVEFLREAYRRTRKDGAAGVDGQGAGEYAAGLEENLESLLNRFKSGTYRAPPGAASAHTQGTGQDPSRTNAPLTRLF